MLIILILAAILDLGPESFHAERKARLLQQWQSTATVSSHLHTDTGRCRADSALRATAASRAAATATFSQLSPVQCS